MPVTPTYPGVYVEEIPSGVRTIVGVSTSDTAFIDFFSQGPLNQAVRINNYAEFERVFGGLNSKSPASYAIQQYYLNGGQIAWVVRVASGNPAPAALQLQGGSPIVSTLKVTAASEGTWGNSLQVGIDYQTRDRVKFPDEFNLVVRRVATVAGRQQVVASEVYRNLSMNDTSPRYAQNVVNNNSQLIKLESIGLGEIPISTAIDVTSAAAIAKLDSSAFTSLGSDAALPAADDGSVPTSVELKAGLTALERIDPFAFNILCLPAAANLTSGLSTLINEAAKFCEDHRAFLIVDIPESENTKQKAIAWVQDNNIRHRNAAVYFPRLIIADALNENRPLNVGASGTLAGIYARTDVSRGVWKAPAGIDATIRGANLAVNLNDADNGDLNPLAINALRTFPIYGNVVWGARTLEGADLQASEWKYIPVRRIALYIEESLFRGLKWVVFEPNDEPLWAQIRLNVGAFMQNLFRQGAFQGKSPREAYFVKCDKETTTQNDINLGIVNIVVGFAPLKPAEFVILKLQQIAGQLET